MTMKVLRALVAALKKTGVVILLFLAEANAQTANVTTANIGSIVAAGGGGGGSTPTFGGELGRWTETSSNATTVQNPSSNVATGSTVVCIIEWNSASQTLTSVTDSGGNTYTINVNVVNNPNSNDHIAIATAYVSTALTTSSTITVNWGSAAYTYRAGANFYATGTASSGQPDATASNNSYGTTVTISASTTATKTCLIGLVELTSTSDTYSASNWTVSGTNQDWQGATRRNYYAYKNATANGTQNPGGSFSVNETWGGAWVALK